MDIMGNMFSKLPYSKYQFTWVLQIFRIEFISLLGKPEKQFRIFIVIYIGLVNQFTDKLLNRIVFGKGLMPYPGGIYLSLSGQFYHRDFFSLWLISKSTDCIQIKTLAPNRNLLLYHIDGWNFDDVSLMRFDNNLIYFLRFSNDTVPEQLSLITL